MNSLSEGQSPSAHQAAQPQNATDHHSQFTKKQKSPRRNNHAEGFVEKQTAN